MEDYKEVVNEKLGKGTLFDLLPNATVKVTAPFSGTVSELCEKITEQETQP